MIIKGGTIPYKIFLAVAFLLPVVFYTEVTGCYLLFKSVFAASVLSLFYAVLFITGGFGKNPRGLYAFLPFFIWTAFSALCSMGPETSKGLLTWGFYLLMCGAAFGYSGAEHVGKIISFAVMSGALVSAYSVLQYFGIDHLKSMDLTAYRYIPFKVFGTLGNPNALAQYLIFPFSLSFAAVFYAKRNWSRALAVSSLALEAGALLATKSRGGIIVLIFIVIANAIYFMLAGKKKTALALVCVLALLASGVWASPDLRSNMTSAADLNYPSVKFRLLALGSALNIWRKAPLAGYGPGSFERRYSEERTPALNIIESETRPRDAHNDYAQLLAETGFIGLGLFLCLAVWLIKEGIRHAKKGPENYIYFCFLVSLSATLVHMTNSFNLNVPVSGFYFFLAAGIIAGAGTERKEPPWPFWPRALAALVFLAVAGYQLYPMCADIAYSSGRLMMAEAVKAPAAALLEKSLMFDRNSYEVNVLYSKIEMGAAGQEVYDTDELWKNILVKRRGADPDKFKAFYNLGIGASDRKNNAAALYYFRRACAVSPYDPSAYIMLAETFKTGGNYRRAAASYGKLYGLAYDPCKAMLEQAVIMEEEGNAGGAAGLYKRIISISGSDYAALSNLGNLLYANGDKKGALENLQKAVSASPEKPEAYINMAYIHFMDNDLDAALLEYGKAIALSNNAEAYTGAGSVYYKKGDLYKAREYWLRGYQYNPGNEKLKYLLVNTGGY